MKHIKPIITIDGWNVYENGGSRFYAVNNGKTLNFEAEYKKGTYFKIHGYYDGKRTYSAERYLYKVIPVVQEITFSLLKHNSLWDYKNQCQALETYKKDITPYYNRCKEKGLETSVFLNELFA